jgi:hypothetical protein
MHDHDQHLSDEELIRAADDALGRRTQKARAHLEGCVHCRNRAAHFESVIEELVQEQRNLDAKFPSITGPRAMLQARLSEMSTDAGGILSRFCITADWLARAFRMAAIAMVVVIAAFLLHRNPAAVSRASAEHDIRPNRIFTPGAARQVSLDHVCSLSHEEVIKPVSPSQRQKVFEEYSIPSDQVDKYEVDFLITPGLGGDDDIRNLWPEPYNSASWNAYVKDALEERLHELVCSRQLDLSEAQRAISTDWIAAYEKYVRASQSNSPAIRRAAPALIAASMTFHGHVWGLKPIGGQP